MFCARVLRTPKRFECSTGSNISTSTPVSAVKLCKPDEPDHSPIEKSSDNSKEFYVASRGSVKLKDGVTDRLPCSPLAGEPSSKSKRILNLQNTPNLNASRPIVSNHVTSTPVNKRSTKKHPISDKELKSIASDKVIEAIRHDFEHSPQGLQRTSPRGVTNPTFKERSMHSVPLKPDKCIDSRPIVSNCATSSPAINERNSKKYSISDKDSKSIASDNIIQAVRKERSMNTCSEKENKKTETSRQRTSSAVVGSRGRTKSNIPMRRKSVSLQDLALIQNKHITGRQSQDAKISSDSTKVNESKPLSGHGNITKKKSPQASKSKTTFFKSKSDLTTSKSNIADKKTNEVTLKSKTIDNPVQTNIKANDLVNSNKNNIKCTEKSTSTNAVAKSKTKDTSCLSKTNNATAITGDVANTHKPKTSEVANTHKHETSEVANTAKPKISEVANTAKPKTGEVATTAKSKTSEVAKTGKDKTSEVVNTVKPKMDDKPASRASKVSHPAPQSVSEASNEIAGLTEPNASSKDVEKDSKTCEIMDKSKPKTSNKQMSGIQNRVVTEPSMSNNNETAKSKSIIDKEFSAKSTTENNESDKFKKINGKSSPHKTRTTTGGNDKLKISEPQCIVGAKIFAQENTLKRSSGEMTQIINPISRDSCGSQRNSDAFQTSKTSFVKRKLYSQCGDFNDDSDNNQDSSFLVQKNNIRDIYCIKKKKSTNVEPKANSGSDTSKNGENQRMYSLRNNNKNIENEGSIKNTAEFVTKILEDISSKNKHVDSKDADKVVADDKKTSKQKEGTSEDTKKKAKTDTSSTDIFDVSGNKKVKAKKDTKKDKSKKATKDTKSASKKDVGSEKRKKKQTSSPRKSARLSKDHSGDLIIVKRNRNAKTNAIGKIHNWSLDLNNSITQSQASNQAPAVKNSKKKTIVVNKECSYILRSSGANDSTVSLSPHLRKAISKLREQQTISSKKPVRRSLEVSLNTKKAIVSKEEHKTNKKYTIKEGISTQTKNRRKEKDGQIVAFKNGQVVTISKGSSENLDNSLDDSFYSTRTQCKPKKMTCNFDLKKPTVPDYDILDQFNMRSMSHHNNGTLVNKYTQATPIIRDPFEFKLLKKYSQRPNEDSIAEHSEIINTLICAPPERNNKASRQIMPYNTSMHAMVPRPAGAMNHYNEFKMPMGNYMPGVSHRRPVTTAMSYSRNTTTKVINLRPNDTFNNTTYSNRSILYTNPLTSLTNRRQNETTRTNNSYLRNSNINYTSRIGNSIPDFIKNPNATSTMSFRGNKLATSSYSFCAKGAEFLKNKYNESTAVRPHNVNSYQHMGQTSVSRYQAEDNRKRKYAEDGNDATVYSKKSKYDDEMSLCSMAGSRPMSSTRIHHDNTQNLRIPSNQSVSGDQSVCKFIMRAPLISDPNRIKRQVTSISTHQIIKPNTQQFIVDRKQDECNFSDDMNETVISAQSFKSNRTVINPIRNMAQSYTHHHRQAGRDETQYEREHRQLKQYNKLTIQNHQQVTRPTGEDHTIRMQNCRQVLDNRQESRELRVNVEQMQNHRLVPKHSLEDKITDNTAKKYKFSSDDVYNFGRKPVTREAQRSDDTFYFKGLYNKCSDISSINTQNTTSATSNNMDDTFRKPSMSILSSKKSSSAHNASILEKYHNLHSTNRTPKRKHAKSSSSSSNQMKNNNPTVGTPVSNVSDKNNVQNRNLVSPWRLW